MATVHLCKRSPLQALTFASVNTTKEIGDVLLQLSSGMLLANGKYLLSSKLGEGGMASVWAATCTKPDDLPDEVVIKVLLPEVRKDEEKRKFFLDEARLSTSLNHPYIVRVFRVEQWNDLDLLIMERIWGESLDQLIQLTHHGKQTPIPWPLAVRMAAMIAEALHYANNAIDRHGQCLNVIHRDIKPGNILVTADGQIKVIDFGIAKASTSQIKTQTGMVKGTIAYMSPEQLRGERLDVRSDLFSLGILLFELCTGQRPFHGENFTALMFSILTKPPIDPAVFRGDLPPELRDLLLALLDKNTSVRPKDAQTLQLQLEAMLTTFPEEGSAEALKEYFAYHFPELLKERSETSKLMAKTDPESLLNAEQRDAIAARAEAVRGSTIGIDALPHNQEYVLPTGEVIRGVRSTMQAEPDPNAPQPPTQLLATNTPDPFLSPAQTTHHPGPQANQHLPKTGDAIRAQDIPTRDLPQDDLPPPHTSNRLLYILSLLIILLGGGGVGLYVYLTGPRPSTTTQTKQSGTARTVALHTNKRPQGTAPQLQAPATPPTTPRVAPQTAGAVPDTVAPQVAPAQTTPRIRSRSQTKRRRRHRRRRRSNRIQRRIVAARPVRQAALPTSQAPTKGHTRIVVTPPCTIYYRGQELGDTNQQATLSAPTGRYQVQCKSKRHLFTQTLRVSVATDTNITQPFRLQRGTLRVLAFPWSNVYLVLKGTEDRKLGTTPQKVRLYEGRYTVVVRHGTEFTRVKTYKIRIRPNRTTTLKVRW